MGRIKEDDRLTVIDSHIAHWTEADALAGLPIELEPGYGIAQLQAQRDAYDAKGDDILQMDNTTLPLTRVQRDTLFGVSDQNEGVRFRLVQYKACVKAKLGARHPLVKTVPNIGRVQPTTYLKIIDRFADHWNEVNAALPAPLAIGDLTLTDLKTAHSDIEEKIQAVNRMDEVQLPLMRAEREVLFGDVPEDEREQTSIVARMQLYHVEIETRFPGQPIADSLPEIFPSESPAGLPTFVFNWSEPMQGQVKLWFEVPDLPDAYQAFMKEGVAEQNVLLDAGQGNLQVVVWDNITMVEELDQLEVQDIEARTLALGVRDENLPEPPDV